MADDTRPIDLIAARVVYLERELARLHDLFSDAIAQLALRQDAVEHRVTDLVNTWGSVSTPMQAAADYAWVAQNDRAWPPQPSVEVLQDELRASLDDVTARRPTVQEQIERG